MGHSNEGEVVKILMFKRRFVPMIEIGVKISTIRGYGNKVQVGDTVSMRYWSGAPYRSKTVEFWMDTVASIEPCLIGHSTSDVFICVGQNHRHISYDSRHAIARGEGFKDWWEMSQFFIAMHDLPFCGKIIRWQPKLLTP